MTRAAHHQARAVLRVAAVEQRVDRLARGHVLERGVLAVDGLGPRRGGAAYRRLEHVGQEARVGEREVERLLARGAGEVEGRRVGGREALRDAVGHRLLDERLVVQAVVGPRRGDDRVGQVMDALGVLLDRDERPVAVVLGQGPVLGEGDRRVVVTGRVHPPPVGRLDPAHERGREAHHGAVLLVGGAVDQAHVLDGWVAHDAYATVPAAGVEVVQTPLPLDEQIAADQLAQARAVAPVPRSLDMGEELRGLAGDALGVERCVVLRGLGGRQHHLLHALAPAPAHTRGADGADRTDGEEHEDDQREEDEAAASSAGASASTEAAASSATAASTAAAPESGGAAARLGECEEEREVHGSTVSRLGPRVVPMANREERSMSTGAIIAIVVVVLIVLAVIAVLMPRMRAKSRERQLLRERGAVADAHRERASARALVPRRPSRSPRASAQRPSCTRRARGCTSAAWPTTSSPTTASGSATTASPAKSASSARSASRSARRVLQRKNPPLSGVSAPAIPHGRRLGG